MADALKVVMVEDDEALAAMLIRFLRNSGVEIHHAADGATGLALVKSVSPHVLLADLMIPEMSGAELIAALRGDETQRIPVVAMSASISPGSQATTMNSILGADVTLAKPLVLKELLDTLWSVSGRSRPA